jgi:hypothetical protein
MVLDLFLLALAVVCTCGAKRISINFPTEINGVAALGQRGKGRNDRNL